MTQQRAGFARTDDGLQLYYRAVGSGPALVCCNGVGVSTFFFKYIAEHFASTHTVVLWDYRGHGRSSLPSDIPNADLTIPRNARDLFTVMDALELPSGVLLGHSMGCQVILEATVQQPDRVSGLVPMFGTFGRPLDTFLDNPNSRHVFGVINKLGMAGGKNGSRLLLPLYANPLADRVGRWVGLVDKHFAPRVDIERYLEHMGQMDPRVFLRMVDLMADHDMEPHLPAIDCPSLVIAGERDVFTPLHRSQRMAELLPNAELMVLAEGSHAAIVEYPDTINRRIARFLQSHLNHTL